MTINNPFPGRFDHFLQLAQEMVAADPSEESLDAWRRTALNIVSGTKPQSLHTDSDTQGNNAEGEIHSLHANMRP